MKLFTALQQTIQLANTYVQKWMVSHCLPLHHLRMVRSYLTLVAVDNVNGSFADFTSTLEVMVDDIKDGTTIACDITIDEDQLTISKSNQILLYSPK